MSVNGSTEPYKEFSRMSRQEFPATPLPPLATMRSFDSAPGSLGEPLASLRMTM
jgi:hypothetical protein